MNHTTRLTATVWGVLLGISSMSHGFFETLQGNTPTNGTFIHAIGEAHQMWEHGTEPAFTLIPNFLFTGIAAMLVGLVIIIWSIGFIHRKNGVTILLSLFILSVLVGGGIAQVLLFPIIVGIATRIHKPLTWWQKRLAPSVRPVLARVWMWALGISALLLFITLMVATFGYLPTIDDPDQVVSLMGLFLFTGLGLYIFSFIAGLARDIEYQPRYR